MTQHYKVHIILAKTTMKMSYRNGKFFKLEKLTGKLTQAQIKKIGVVIPPVEDKIEAYKAHWKDKVTYDLIKKKTTLYNQFLDAWLGFYDGIMGIKPHFNAVEGHHLKKIMSYLKTIEQSDAARQYANWGGNFVKVITKAHGFYKGGEYDTCPTIRSYSFQHNAFLKVGRRIKNDGEPAFTLNAQDRHGVMINDEDIRRFTEVECERLQGFPDNWTKHGDYDGQIKEISKNQRYKQLGNAVTTVVVKTITKKLITTYSSLG